MEAEVNIARLSLERLQPYREELLARAIQLHGALGLSPSSELSPDQLVEGAFARSLRNQSAYKGRTAQELRNWLFEQLRNHAEERWADILTRYLNLLTRYARMRWKAWGLPSKLLEPGELADHTLARAKSHHHTFRGRSEGEYVVWLQRILDNHARDQIDRELKAKKRNSYVKSLDEAIEASSTPVEQLVADTHQPTPSYPVRREEWRRQICAEIDKLPSPQREAIILKLQERTIDETAQELGLPKHVVSRVIREALEKLRPRLAAIAAGP
jgi:RNA polymerase sigma factor (sigma-70 family)